jgi:hypothetical protein
MEREMAWMEAFAAKYEHGIGRDQYLEAYLEMSRHFQTKREQARTEREARQWAKLQGFVDAQGEPEAGE